MLTAITPLPSRPDPAPPQAFNPPMTTAPLGEHLGAPMRVERSTSLHGILTIEPDRVTGEDDVMYINAPEQVVAALADALRPYRSREWLLRPFVTITEVCTILRISRRTLQLDRDAGHGHYGFGSRILYAPEQVEAVRDRAHYGSAAAAELARTPQEASARRRTG